jgi:hypothetical protein
MDEYKLHAKKMYVSRTLPWYLDPVKPPPEEPPRCDIASCRGIIFPPKLTAANIGTKHISPGKVVPPERPAVGRDQLLAETSCWQ